MSNSFFAFTVTFVGGVLIALLSNWAESKYKPTTMDESSSEIQPYSRKRSVVAGALAVFIAWMAILWFVFGLLFVKVTGLEPNEDVIAYYPFGVCVAGVLFYVVYGFLLRCDYCKRRVLVQESEYQQRYAKRHRYFSAWGFVVVDILFKKQFQCMSCGKKYTV